MAGTLSAPNAIKDIYKKLVFFDIESSTAPYEFQYTDAATLDDVQITNVKNYFTFDNQIKFDSTIVGPTNNFTYPIDVTQLAADIYGGAQPSSGDHLPNLGGISSTHWSITNGSLIDCLIGEKTDRIAQDVEHSNELNQIERLITGSATGWAHDDYISLGNPQNPYIEGAGGALIPATYYIDSGADNITGNAADGLIDADQILDQEIYHNRTWLESLQNLWDGADGAASPPLHPSGNGAGNNTAGTFNNTYLDMSAPATPRYIADINNTNIARPGTGNTTVADASSIKDALLKLDYEIHKNESWLSEIHEALYGADDLLDDTAGNTVGETPRDNVLQEAALTKVTFREFGTSKDHDSWARHGNTNSGSYLTKETASAGASLEGSIGRVNSFSQAIAELDYQIKNLWDRRDLDRDGSDNGGTKGAQTANTDRKSLEQLKADVNSFMANVIGCDASTAHGSIPYYTATVGNTYATDDLLRDQIDDLDAQLQHLTDAVQNADTGAVAWSSDVAAGASVLEDVNSLHTELNTLETNIGTDDDGVYTSPTGTYLGNNVIKDDIDDLDAQLHSITDSVFNSSTAGATWSTDVGGGNSVKEDIEWMWDTIWQGGASAGTYAIIDRLNEIVDISTGSKVIKFSTNPDANQKQIKNMAAGTAADDAVTYSQLQLAQAGFTPGYAAKVATQQIADSAGLVADAPAQAGGPYTAPAGGLMAIDTSHTLANYNSGAAKTWDNKDNITLDGTDYEHGGLAYDSDLAPKTITSNTVYIDGIEVEDGDYVLVTGEALAAVDGATWRESTQTGEFGWHWRNGIWIFHDSSTNGGVWERPPSDILWEAGTGVGLGQCHPVRQGYQNGLSVFESCAATVGPGDPSYPIESCATETQANAEALYGGGRVVSAWCIFTGIQSIGSGNVTSVKNYNEIWLDFDSNEFQVSSGSPDYLELHKQPYASSYGEAGSDMIPLHVDANGIGLKVDNDFFTWDTGSGVNRLTLRDNQPIVGENMNLDVGGLVYNITGYEDKLGLGTNTPDAKFQIVEDGGHTSGNITMAHSMLDLYNPLEENTDEKGSVITFSDNYEDGGGFHRTIRAAIKGGTDTVGNTADGFLAFYTDSSTANSAIERMRINHDGYVGIGVTDPDRMLEVGTGGMRVDGGICIDWSTPMSGVSITAAAAGWSRGFNAINQVEDTRIAAFYHYGTGDTMIRSGISPNYDDNQGIHYEYDGQQVGINTYSPEATLHINDDSDVGLGSSAAPLMIGAHTGTSNMMIDYNEILVQNNGGGRKLHLNNYDGGEVRIGSTVGSAQLGLGVDTIANKTLAMGDDAGGATASFYFDLSSVSSAYTAQLSMDDVGIHLGTNSEYRDIHIKGDRDNTPKGIEIDAGTGDLRVDGAIEENGTSLLTRYGNIYNGTAIPSGAVIMWSGSVATIPNGWLVCDGTNGTPNLEDRFVMGSTTYSGGVHDTGGSNETTLTTAELPSHNHIQSTHTHGMGHTHDFTDTHSHTVDVEHTHTLDITHGHNAGLEPLTTAGGGAANDIGEHYHGSGNYSVNATGSGNFNTASSNVGTLNAPNISSHTHSMVHTHQMNEQHTGNYHDATGGDTNVWKQGYETNNTSNASTNNTGYTAPNANAPTGGSHYHAGVVTVNTSGNVNGGSANATLSIPNHTHGIAGHSHSISSGGGEETTSNQSNSANPSTTTATVSGTTGGTSGTGDTSAVAPNIGNTGAGSSYDSRPAYYALVFIMKS